MLKKIFTVSLFLLWSSALMAGDCFNCTIKSLGFGPYYNGICGKACVFIMVEGTIANKPSCSVDWNFVADTSTEGGRQALSQLLAAYATSKPINIVGDDTCTLYSSSEDFYYGYFAY